MSAVEWSRVTSGDLEAFWRIMNGFYLSVVQAPSGSKLWYGSFNHEGYPGVYETKREAMKACELEAQRAKRDATTTRL